MGIEFYFQRFVKKNLNKIVQEKTLRMTGCALDCRLNLSNPARSHPPLSSGRFGLGTNLSNLLNSCAGLWWSPMRNGNDSPTSVQIPEILRLEERRNFIFGTWNVRSFKKENENKILDELEHFNVDIACLQETRCQEDILEKRDYKVVMKCYNKDMKFGLGFIIKKDLYQYTHFESNPTERICSLKLRTDAGNIHIINVYVPHTNNDSEMIEECFGTLAKKLSKISEDEIVFLLGDFNSHVGSDNVVWSTCLGEHGIGYRVTDSGQRLLEFCTFHDLCITHSFFDQTGNVHYTFLNNSSPKISSKLSPFPNSYIDFCITRNKHRHCVKMTKSNLPKKSSTEKFVIGDHLLVTSNIELTFNHPNQTKSLSKSQHMLLVSFIIVLRNQRTTKKPDVDDIENQWKQISDIIFKTSNKHQHSKDQFCKFEKYLKEMNDFIDSLPEIKKGSGIDELTDEKVKYFDVFFKNILILFTWLDEQKSMQEDIKKINITKETITELLNSAIFGYGSGNNSNNFVNCKYSAFLNLPSIDEIEKSFKIHKFENILKQAKMNKLDEILKQQTYKLYELCWQYQYCPMELVYVSIAYVYNRLDTCTDGFYNLINVIYTIGKCYAEIIHFRINQLRVETDKDRCVQGSPKKTTLLIKLCQQPNEESQTCFQGFFSVLDDLENDNKIFFKYLSTINTPFEIRKRFSSVIGYLRCWKCLNAEKYFCHRDTQTDCCLIDVILSELTWSVINTNLKTKRHLPEFSDEIFCLASYLNSAVIQTNSLKILKECITHLAFDCEKIGLNMCTTKILTHNVKNEDVVDIMHNEQLTEACEVNFLDVIFSQETKKNYYNNVLHNISKACVAMSEMLKTIPSGTKPTYDKMIVQYGKSVSNVLTSNCDIYEKYFSRPKKQLLVAFDIKCKKKIEEACGICTPTVNQKIYKESQKSKKRVSLCVPDRFPIKKSKTSVPRKNKPSIINILRKKYQKMIHKIRRN